MKAFTLVIERVGNGVIVKPYYPSVDLANFDEIKVFNEVWQLNDFLESWFNETKPNGDQNGNV